MTGNNLTHGRLCPGLRIPLPAIVVSVGLALSGGCGGGGSTPSAPPPARIAAPSITVQPASASVPMGLTATYSVTAAGSSPQYQWARDGRMGMTFSPSLGTPLYAGAGDCAVPVMNGLGCFWGFSEVPLQQGPSAGYGSDFYTRFQQDLQMGIFPQIASVTPASPNSVITSLESRAGRQPVRALVGAGGRCEQRVQGYACVGVLLNLAQNDPYTYLGER